MFSHYKMFNFMLRQRLLFLTADVAYDPAPSYGGPGENAIHSLSCSGSENKLTECSFTSNLSCTHDNDIVVECFPSELNTVLLTFIVY